jgi:glutamate dehydrogenase/leucine dehydrogenase
MANAPTTEAGGKMLHEKQVLVIPDVLANAGGVAVSYFEWLQNMKDEKWTKDQVFTRLQQKMEHATDAVFEAMKTFDVSMREAGYIVAIKRIESAWEKRAADSVSQFKKQPVTNDFGYYHTQKR